MRFLTFKQWNEVCFFRCHFRFLSCAVNLAWVGISHDQFSDLSDLLGRCARNRSVREGEIYHAQVIQRGLADDTLVSNVLVNFYWKCGFLSAARKVFDGMPRRSIVSWNTIIGAMVQHREDQQALKLFVEMQREGTQSSEFTLSSVLCACAAKSAVEVSKQLHGFALKTALSSNAFVGTAVLDVYAKCGLVGDALEVFDNMEERTDVTWSSMVAGLVQNEHYEDALILVHRAQKMGLEYNEFTLSAALSACASLAASIEGNQVHSVLVRTGFDSSLHVATSLLHMYAKCGSIEDAYSVFSCAEEKNVALWNAIISGFSRHALCTEAMILFEKMQQVGLDPNEVTFISVISACSHMGWVEEGQNYFDLMITDYDIKPNFQHYACMVDVLGRAGQISKARDLMEKMPCQPTASMWGSLLSSCRIYRDAGSAEIAVKHLCEIEPNNAGNLVLLSNIYAAGKRWEDVVKVRKLLKERGVRKEKGKSWIEVNCKVHTFIAGEGSHPMIGEIYAKLEELETEMRKSGYKAEVDCDTHDVSEAQKEELLRHHSEKLALAFGLISLPSAAPIKIKKNLRICGDCHSTMKFVSRITGRVIIVRDTNRFHHFRDGSCSCLDFW